MKLKLTALQKLVYELRHSRPDGQLLSFREVAERLEITKEQAASAYYIASRKVALQHHDRERDQEEKKDARVAEFIDEVTNPDRFKAVARIAREVGVDQNVVAELVKRLNGKWVQFGSMLREVKNKDLLALLDDRLIRILESISDQDIEVAPLRDKAVTIGILTDKRAVLRGEPTHIVSIEDRRTLDELVPELLKVIQRRGITIDVDPIDQTTKLVPAPENLVKFAKHPHYLTAPPEEKK